jgi:hypothetical protein
MISSMMLSLVLDVFSPYREDHGAKFRAGVSSLSMIKSTNVHQSHVTVALLLTKVAEEVRANEWYFYKVSDLSNLFL